MNKHDSERVSGMLDLLGALPVSQPEDADIVVFMTCCVREAADVRLKGQVASLKNLPSPKGRRYIAVGGCIGQRDGEKLCEELGMVDIVFGTHTISALPSLLQAAIADNNPQVSLRDTSEDFSTSLPSHREFAWRAWVPITTGCDNFCTYCIVPYVRGREKSRTLEDITNELGVLHDQGVKEITFLGQNVNSYGRDLYGKPCFARVLELAGESGIPRIRFATSHPKDLSSDTIHAMAKIDSVMPQLHLPVQSGSDRILRSMNRNYTASSYLNLIDKVRCEVGDIALSTDIIVGFPGETQEDFEATMNLCREVGYHQAFTFIYSKRAGTPAASMPDNTPHEVIQARFDALVELIQETAYKANQVEKGTVQEVLVDGTSRRDNQVIAGRSPKNQMVHALLPHNLSIEAIEGRFIQVKIDEAKTWYLKGSMLEDGQSLASNKELQ